MGKRHTLDASFLNLRNIDNARFLDRENDNLDRYLKDVRKYKILEPDEELSLIAKYQKRLPGYERAKELIIGSHQRFVIMVAKRYRPINVDLCDLINEANIGLTIALDNFDASFNTKFITFAGRYVIKYIFEYLENAGFIQQPNRSKIHGVINRVNEEFFNENGYYPTIDELQEEFKKRGISIKDKSDFVNITIESIDQPIENSDDDDVREYGDDDNIEERTNLEFVRKNIADVLDKLTDIEKTIVVKTFGFGGVEEDIATIAFELGTSEYKVKCILSTAIGKLRKYKSIFE